MSGLTKKERMARKDPLSQTYAAMLGANLRRLRKERNLSQGRLGLMMGTQHPRISDIERGRVVIGFDDVAKLCRALEVDPADLIDLPSITLSDHPLPPERHARP